MTKLLLLVPVLISISGCGEKIEAQESEAIPTEVMTPPEEAEDKADAHQDDEVELKLQPPGGID